MSEGCAYCGGIVCVHSFMRHNPGYTSSYDPGRWTWDVFPDRHCRRRWCRTLDAYWFKGRVGKRQCYRPHNMQWRGPAIYLYELAEFLRRMAEPKTWRDLEFCKRFAYRPPRRMP